MLRKVLLKVLTWHTRPLLIWLESIFLESLGTTTGPVPCCTKQLTAYPTHCVFLGLHCCWWFFLSWNSLPKYLISHISTRSLRMWLRVTCSGKPYITYSRNSAFFTPCFLMFWVALCLRGGAPLLWAHRRWEDCAHRRGEGHSVFSSCLDLSSHLPIAADEYFRYFQAWDRTEGGKAKGAGKFFLSGYHHGDHMLWS